MEKMNELAPINGTT